MATCELNGILINKMFANGYRNLKRNMDVVNNLNVFPVPDGDTGTNMTMTLGGGVASAEENIENISDYMKKFSRKTLLSARGNSGVIFSQFIHGLATGVKNKEILTLEDFPKVMECGKIDSYNSVISPVDGTMLTLIREACDYLQNSNFESFEDCFDKLIIQMKNTLSKTPEMLPVLKEAGVVDSGGAGLICIFEGMNSALNGEFIDEGDIVENADFTSAVSEGYFGPDSVLEYGYCTEFILQLQNAKTDIENFSIKPVIEYLETIGDSIVAVQDCDLIKVHVHTFQPEDVLAFGRKFGEFISIKIENMSVQHSEVVSSKPKDKPQHQKYCIVAVATGKGIQDYYKEIGASYIINGGQTQNPSAEDFITAFDSLNCDYIIVLPNNSNVVMTAQQAASLYKKADVRVIPTKSIAEGYSALSMVDLSKDTVEELIEDMSSYLPYISTGLVTTATRDTSINGVEIRCGDYIGLDRETIISAEKDKITATVNMLKGLPNIEEKQVLTIFYGNDVTNDELSLLEERLNSEFPLIEHGFIEGKQDIYSFIMAIE